VIDVAAIIDDLWNRLNKDAPYFHEYHFTECGFATNPETGQLEWYTKKIPISKVFR
jgi:hypothetical protein